MFQEKRIRMAKKSVHKSGKRKTAVARTTVRKGKSKVRVNSQTLEVWGPEMARMRIEEVLHIASSHIDLDKIDIEVNAEGGGIMGQADSIASSIARALVEFSDDEELLNKYLDYDRTLIAGDHRVTEPHKPSQSSKGPRHKKQKSYR